MFIMSDDIVLFMHGSRVFAFGDVTGLAGNDEEAARRNDATLRAFIKDTRDFFLHMLTHPKYRLLTGLYTVVHTVDTAMYYVLVLRVLIDHDNLDPCSIYILAVALLDLMFQTMESQNSAIHFWVLHRVSIFITFALYVLYFITFQIQSLHCESEINKLSWILLGIRFGAFLLETLIDYFIDYELHHDILHLTPSDHTSRPEGLRSLHVCCCTIVDGHGGGWLPMQVPMGQPRAGAQGQRPNYLGSCWAYLPWLNYQNNRTADGCQSALWCALTWLLIIPFAFIFLAVGAVYAVTMVVVVGVGCMLYFCCGIGEWPTWFSSEFVAL
mmetsp:Transcript_9224/g.31439  ORF Transcript_9224/g.31439 Transcript_9224/m.31439 type:complete len:326 (+) Transcript_9224:287-1264(+)